MSNQNQESAPMTRDKLVQELCTIIDEAAKQGIVVESVNPVFVSSMSGVSRLVDMRLMISGVSDN